VQILLQLKGAGLVQSTGGYALAKRKRPPLPVLPSPVGCRS
jgi:hypothetical protein